LYILFLGFKLSLIAKNSPALADDDEVDEDEE
jgi:hypothetical protein